MKGIVPWLLGVLVGVMFGYSCGRGAGYDRALADIKAITPPPRTTDQQCVAWLFDANMKDVKKKVCK